MAIKPEQLEEIKQLQQQKNVTIRPVSLELEKVLYHPLPFQATVLLPCITSQTPLVSFSLKSYVNDIRFNLFSIPQTQLWRHPSYETNPHETFVSDFSVE